MIRNSVTITDARSFMSEHCTVCLDWRLWPWTQSAGDVEVRGRIRTSFED
jgi:hypothetical protein